MQIAIIIILPEGALLIVLQSRVEELVTWLGIEPTTFDLSN